MKVKEKVSLVWSEIDILQEAFSLSVLPAKIEDGSISKPKGQTLDV